MYDTLPVFRQLKTDVSSQNSKGNVVEACVGASFVATYELQQRVHYFRTEPPDALAHAAAMFPLVRGLRREHANTQTRMALSAGSQH